VFRPNIDGKATKDDFRLASEFCHALPTPWLEPEDVAEPGLFLASGSSKYMTGTSISIDAGCMIEWPSGPAR